VEEVRETGGGGLAVQHTYHTVKHGRSRERLVHTVGPRKSLINIRSCISTAAHLAAHLRAGNGAEERWSRKHRENSRKPLRSHALRLAATQQEKIHFVVFDRPSSARLWPPVSFGVFGKKR